jgi:hypothetical protein
MFEYASNYNMVCINLGFELIYAKFTSLGMVKMMSWL